MSTTSPTTEQAIPPGYEIQHLEDGFINVIGPLYARHAEDGTLAIAFRVDARHVNRYERVHGGMMASLADSAIGLNMHHVDDAYGAVTTTLTVDYVGAARMGDWVEATVSLHKKGGRIRFGTCHIHVGETMVLRSNATFYVPPRNADGSVPERFVPRAAES